MRILGQEMDLLIDDKILACAKGFDLEVVTNDLEYSSPDSGTWKDFEPVLNEWRLTAQHLYTKTSDNFQELFEYASSRLTFDVKMRRIDEEGWQYLGTAHITSLRLGANVNVPVGIGFAMRGHGELLSDEIFKLWATEDEQDFIVDENDDFILI